MAMVKTKRKPCPGNFRHWFAPYGLVGLRSPVCVRWGCNEPNPKVLTEDELGSYEDYMDYLNRRTNG